MRNIIVYDDFYQDPDAVRKAVLDRGFPIPRGGTNNQTLRTMSALIYLNDNYEGGEIDFPRQEVKIKPTAGMLVMFPAILTFPHASLPVKSGTKYTVVTWFR